MEDVESHPLLPPDDDRGNAFAKQQKLRDQSMRKGVYCLYYIYVTITWASLISLTLYFTDLYAHNVIPLFAVFIPLWLGHVVYLIIIFQCFYHIFQAILAPSKELQSNERFTPKWQQMNQKRIPLIQFTLYHLGWITGVAIIFLTCEILLYYQTISVIPSYSVLIPMYFLTCILLSNSLVCKSTSLHQIICWLLIFITLVLINVKLVRNASYSYYIVFIAIFKLFLYLAAKALYIFINYLNGYYLLEFYQVVASVTYFFAFMTLFFSVFCYAGYLEGYSYHGYSNLKIAVGLLICGLALIYAVLSKIFSTYLDDKIIQLGADKPQKLTKLPTGGWDVDHDNYMEYNILLGEITTRGSLLMDIISVNESRELRNSLSYYTCGCYNNTVEMLNRSERHSFSRTGYASE